MGPIHLIRDRAAPWVLPLVLAALLGAVHAHAQERRGAVTYVTSTTVYADLGRRDGFMEGDTLLVRGQRGDSTAVLLVAHIATRSLAATYLLQRGEVRQGDAVTGIPHIAPVVADTTARAVATTTDMPAPASMPLLPRVTPVEGTRVQGRFSLQYSLMQNDATPQLDFSQPGAVISFNAAGIAGAPLDFSWYSNHRYDARTAEALSPADPRMRHRIYECSARYGDAAAAASLTAGRFVPAIVGGIGTIDGALAAMHRGPWEVGAAIGAQPGYYDSRVSLADPKGAAYVAYTDGDAKIARYQGALAYAQIYRSGALDRGYAWLVNNLSMEGGRITLYQSMSVDMYDAGEGGGTLSPHLTDMYLSGNWRAATWLSVTGSYATMRNVYYLRSTQGLPAASFRPNRQQSVQLGAGANIPGGMYLALTGQLRAREEDPRLAPAVYARYSFSDLFETGMTLFLTGGYTDNIYNTSSVYSIEVTRDLFQKLYAALRAQRQSYSYDGGARRIDRMSLGTDLYFRLTTQLFLSLSGEIAHESTATTQRVYMEATYRIL